VAIETSIRP